MSDDLTFQDTPLYAWLKANAWSLLAGVAILLGILLYRENAPKWKQANLGESWEQFRALAGGSEGLDDLATRLAEAKKDSRIYEWVVYTAANEAAATQDAKALALLKPELESLAKTSTVKLAGATGAESLAASLLRSLYSDGSKLPTDPVAPAPTGSKIKVTLSVGPEKTYDVVYGLYEDVAPNGTAALKKWVTDGRFVDQEARKNGTQSVTWKLVPLPEPETPEGVEAPKPAPLMVERQYGVFHFAGTLATGMIPSSVGEQDVNNLILALTDSFSSDGQTTVLGKAVEGFDELKAALELADAGTKIRCVGAELLP